MNPNFLCRCSHRNKMHLTVEDAAKGYNIKGRICFEYKNYPNPTINERICMCPDFEPDNLKTLELLSNVK